MTTRLPGLLVVVLTAANCAPPPPSLTCGDGTTQNGRTCVTTRRCAAGTHEDGSACVADASTPVTCGVGTHLDGAACVVDAPPGPPTSPWSAPVPVCEAGVACSEPTLVQTPAGAVVVVSESGDTSMSVSVYRQTTTGFTLSKRFDGASSVAMTPTLAVRGATLYLAYTDYTPSGGQQYGTGDLMLSVSADFGATWTQPRRINAQPATSLLYAPRLTLSSAGLDLIYLDTDGQTTQDNYYLHSNDDGATFSEPVKLPSGGQYDSLTVTAPAVRVGDVLEVPTQRSGYDLASGGPLSNVEVLTVTPMPTLQTHTAKVKRVFSSRDFPLDPVPVLSASPSGVRCLAFIDAPSRDYSIYVVRSEGPLDGMQRPVLVPGGPGSVQAAPTIVATAAGDCALSWLDNRSGNWELYEATLLADGTWRAPGRVSPMGFTEDGITKSLHAKVSLAVGGATRQLAWTDFRDGREAVSFAEAPLTAP